MEKKNIFSFAITIVTLFVVCIMMVCLFNATVPAKNNETTDVTVEVEQDDELNSIENFGYTNKYTLMNEISSLSKQIADGEEKGEDVSELILRYGILYAQMHRFKDN